MTDTITATEWRRLKGLPVPGIHAGIEIIRGLYGDTVLKNILAKPCTDKPEPKKRTMNKTETLYAEILAALQRNGIVRQWAFEAIRLKLADGAYYKPDFLVWKADGSIELIETKGAFCREAALVRYKVARDLYPMFVWRFMKYTRKDGWIEK